MKVLFVHALPFHRWILHDLAVACQEAGLDVETYTHVPAGPTDWLTNHLRGGDPVAKHLHAIAPDLVVAAEYPYLPLRDVCDAPVLATRHSLAARGNTWTKEQADADMLVAWSKWDLATFERQFWWRPEQLSAAVLGCVWAHGVARITPEPERMVLWCPSWNASLSCREQVTRELCALRGDGIQIAIRPHAATAWREPEWLTSLARLSFDVLDSDAPPGPDLARASAIVSDVSGIGLLATCSQDGKLPVVWVDPPRRVLTGLAQYDPTGPEWSFRSSIGHRCPEGVDLARTLRSIFDIGDNGGVLSRRSVRDTILGGTKWTEGACERVAGRIQQIA